MNFTKKMPTSVLELEALYNDTSSGHWFSKDSMRFFKTRLLGDFKRINDKTAYFITTEQCHGKRRATIRKATIEHIKRGTDKVSKVSICTHGEFCILTIDAAKKILGEL